jgi:hypothetical protein
MIEVNVFRSAVEGSFDPAIVEHHLIQTTPSNIEYGIGSVVGFAF